MIHKIQYVTEDMHHKLYREYDLGNKRVLVAARIKENFEEFTDKSTQKLRILVTGSMLADLHPYVTQNISITLIADTKDSIYATFSGWAYPIEMFNIINNRCSTPTQLASLRSF